MEPAERKATTPNTRVTAHQVEDAYAAYQATQHSICDTPSLADNQYFIALQDTAYARFCALFHAWDGE